MFIEAEYENNAEARGSEGTCIAQQDFGAAGWVRRISSGSHYYYQT